VAETRKNKRTWFENLAEDGELPGRLQDRAKRLNSKIKKRLKGM
jgi:hypothetical protein